MTTQRHGCDVIDVVSMTRNERSHSPRDVGGHGAILGVRRWLGRYNGPSADRSLVLEASSVIYISSDPYLEVCNTFKVRD